MRTYVALLRGINVGGRHALRMADLRAMLQSLGLRNVLTYIQSGNAVFRGDDTVAPADLSHKISAVINASHGFEPRVLVLTADEFQAAVDANPFPEAESEPRSLHLNFLGTTPVTPDLAGLDALRAAGERFALKGNLFYLHAPDGIGRSKLAGAVEKLLGVEATSRNWRTVQKIMSLVTETSGE